MFSLWNPQTFGVPLPKTMPVLWGQYDIYELQGPPSKEVKYT